MAIKPETEFPGKIIAGNANYPQGEARNVTISGDGTGTPWRARLINDVWGFFQRLLNDASITPSGNPDTVVASDYKDALDFIYNPGNPSVKYLNRFASLDAAVTSIGSTVTTLIVTELELVTTNILIPNTIHLDFKGVGELSVNSGFIVTINGPISSSIRKIFSGAGSIDFGPGSVPQIEVSWFGTGTADDSVAIQAGINAGKNKHIPVHLSAGQYTVINTITIYNGTTFFGDLGGQFVDSFDRRPIGSNIVFQPTTEKDLFDVAQNITSGSLLGHISISKLFLEGNSVSGGPTNSRYALDLFEVNYSVFRDMGIQGFQVGILETTTINNRFKNIFLSKNTTSSVEIKQTATSSVYSQVTFFGSPVGVELDGSIGIRFQDCLFEQLDTYGLRQTRETQNTMLTDCYAEDVPFVNLAGNSMFNIGHTGTTLVVENHLTVTGGRYSGRNAGAVGSFMDIDYSNGVMLSGVNASRYTNILKSTANTRDKSIVIAGISGISFTVFATDATKLAGFFPNGVINSGSNTQDATFGNINTSNIEGGGSMTLGASFININSLQLIPLADDITSLGSASKNWSEIHMARFLEGKEIADPTAPAANIGRLYFKDNGSAKTQLVVKFNTGAVQVIATQL